MPFYEITLRTDCEYATTNIVAVDKNAAMAEAKRLCDEETDTLDWEQYEGNAFPINQITIRDADGNEVAEWLSDELRASLAGNDLLEALEYFFNIMHDYESSQRKGYVKLALDQAQAAIAKAKGGAA